MPEPEPSASKFIDHWKGGFLVFVAISISLCFGAFCTLLVVLPGARFEAAAAKTPLMLVWALLVGATGALAGPGVLAGVGACGDSWTRINELRAPDKKELAWTVGALGLLLAAVVGGAFAVAGSPLEFSWPLGNQLQMLIVMMLVVTPVLAAIVGMWFMTMQAWIEFDLAWQDKQSLTVDDIASYLDIRDREQGLLWFAGIVIGAAMLAMGVLRQALVDGRYASEAELPESLVLGFGAYFTLLLVIGYLPTHVLMRRVGMWFVNGLAKGDEPIAWHENRLALTQMLRIDGGLQDKLATALVILAPIVSSLMSLALPGK